jgi:hypothetical protein
MNKRANTLLFVLGATILNVLLYFVGLIALLALYSVLSPSIPESAQQWVFALILLLPIGISFLLYRLILKVVLKYINPDEHFAPLLGGRRGQKPRD